MRVCGRSANASRVSIGPKERNKRSAFALPPTASQAYTPEEQQACSNDAFRLCGPEIPDVDRVTVCMIRNKAQLSPDCRAFFRPPEPESAPIQVNTGKPLSIRPVTARKPVKSRKPKKPV